MGLFVVFLMMLSIIGLVVPLPVTGLDREELAREYYLNRILSTYQTTGSFSCPSSPSWYPFVSCSVDSDKIQVKLAGKDRKLNTSDDLVLTITKNQVQKIAYEETERRARVLEQAVYSLCQRRLAEKKYPIFLPTLTQFLNTAGIPQDYAKNLITNNYFHYDISTCKTNYCYCTEDVIRW